MQYKYCEMVCGSVLNAQRLIVADIIRERNSKGLIPEQIDRAAGFHEPVCALIEDDPSLLSSGIFQKIANSGLDNDEGIMVCCIELNEVAESSIKCDSALKELTLREFKSSVTRIHITDYGPNPEKYFEKNCADLTTIFEGRAAEIVPEQSISPNRISADTWALIHIEYSIFREIDRWHIKQLAL